MTSTKYKIKKKVIFFNTNSQLSAHHRFGQNPIKMCLKCVEYKWPFMLHLYSNQFKAMPKFILNPGHCTVYMKQLILYLDFKCTT